MNKIVKRFLADRLIEATNNFPVVLLQGSRQVGKSTLVKQLAGKHLKADYVTLDDAQTLSSAVVSPQEFILSLQTPVVIDEVQRAPEMFRAVKLAVDRARKPGMFLLTGSANVLVLPKLSESLAGRMFITNLWPFSQGELTNRRKLFLDSVFNDPAAAATKSRKSPQPDIAAMIVKGGYPVPQFLSSHRLRQDWFGSYITTILERDVRELADIDRLTHLPNLLGYVANRLGGLLNVSDLSASSGIPQTTLTRYLAMLEATFILQTLPAWSPSNVKRLRRARKIYINDTGLASHLIGADERRLNSDRELFGHLFENFVLMELRKQATWSKDDYSFYHFRTYRGLEVDLVVEDRQGRILGVEIKSGSVVRPDDFKGLRYLSTAFPGKFLIGIVIYTGQQTLPFGESLWAMPLSSLWQ